MVYDLCVHPAGCSVVQCSRTNIHIIINVSLHTTDAAGRQPPVAAAVTTTARDGDGNSVGRNSL